MALKELNYSFHEAAKHKQDPANVHAHKQTIRELTDEVWQAVDPGAKGAKPPLKSVVNPHSGKKVNVVEDDVPEGRYFFSD